MHQQRNIIGSKYQFPGKEIEWKRCRAFTHHYPLTSRPLFCSCWRQVCLCSRGRSVDLQVWCSWLAAPCGETRSRGPCAPSGFSIDLNNCKTQRRFAKHDKRNLSKFECRALFKCCLTRHSICLWFKNASCWVTKSIDSLAVLDLKKILISKLNYKGYCYLLTGGKKTSKWSQNCVVPLYQSSCNFAFQVIW